MNNTQKRTLRRIIIEAALLLLLLPLQARAAEYKFLRRTKCVQLLKKI